MLHIEKQYSYNNEMRSLKSLTENEPLPQNSSFIAFILSSTVSKHLKKYTLFIKINRMLQNHFLLLSFIATFVIYIKRELYIIHVLCRTGI